MSQSNPGFSAILTREILSNVYNYYVCNKDYERSNVSVMAQAVHIVKAALTVGLRKLLNCTPLPREIDRDLSKFDEIIQNLSSFEQLYNSFEDEASKSTLIKILAYRILGRRRVQLPLANAAYWKRRKHMRSLVTGSADHNAGLAGMKLKLLDLTKIGYDMKILSVPFGAFNIFELKQYEYVNSYHICKAERNDIIIDAGACWGDSSLYFANEVGNGGKIYSFEFISNNLRVFKENLSLNKHLADRIQIIQQPIWETSGQIFYVVDRGPASGLTQSPQPDAAKIETTSIDDFVERNNLPKVDFIKMDIEGAELDALKGCEKTLRRFQPKLAISVYHKPDDLFTIAQFIISLGLRYHLFLGHYTTHHEETVLFAKCAS